MLPERTDRIGGSNDSAASLQWCDDSSFRNGDALLLHGFMDAGPVLIVHLNYEEKKQVHLSIQLKIALNWSKKIGESASKTSLKLQTGPNFNIHSPYQLVNEADSSVCQHQSSCLQRPLSTHGMTLHVSRQTHGGSALTCSEDCATRNLLDVL